MTGPAPLGPALRTALRVVRRRRGLLAAVLTAAAVASALPALAPPAEPGTVVLAAARDLPAGAVLSDDDVVRLPVPVRARPEGSLAAVDGLRLAGPVRRGEPLTDLRVLGAGLLGAAGPGLVASPVRLADAASAALLRAGDRVDVLAAAPDGARPYAATAAQDVLVLAVPAPDAQAAGQADGGLVVLATSPATASRLAAAAVSSRLSAVLLPGASS